MLHIKTDVRALAQEAARLADKAGKRNFTQAEQRRMVDLFSAASALDRLDRTRHIGRARARVR